MTTKLQHPALKKAASCPTCSNGTTFIQIYGINSMRQNVDCLYCLQNTDWSATTIREAVRVWNRFVNDYFQKQKSHLEYMDELENDYCAR